MDDVFIAHDEALTFGGLAGVRDVGLIESAVARPYCGYHRSLSEKAAALVQSMAGNHGFADGNKRTTVVLVHMLISRSGYKLARITPHENLDAALEAVVLGVVNRELSFNELRQWFKARLIRQG